jgi:hypothetical protein
MSLAKILSLGTLDKIVARFSLQEVGAPYQTLSNPVFPQPLGVCRVFAGERVHKTVYIGLNFPPAGLDSHMIFAFTAPESNVPHFTLDSVLAGPHFAFHLDLIPRVDLGANLDYMNAAFQPLTPEFHAAKKIEGLTAAQLSPRQYAIMSPWMLAYRANESAFTQVEPHVNNYLGHWFKLVESGVSAEIAAGGGGAQLAARDQLNRNAIFNPEVDPVWAQIDRMLGADVSAQLREVLRNQNVESSE